MSNKIKKKIKLETRKEIKFYCDMEWLGKSKRLRKKASKILETDSKNCKEEQDDAIFFLSID